MAKWGGRTLLPLALGCCLAFLRRTAFMGLSAELPPPRSRPMRALPSGGWFAPMPKNAPIRPATDEPTSDDVLWGLGCELWAAGSELLVAAECLKSAQLTVLSSRPAGEQQQASSFTSHLPTVIGRSGWALSQASEAMIERRWRSAWAGLEAASGSCQEHLPADSWQGLVELIFTRAELAVMGDPEPAVASLNSLSAELDALASVVELHPDLQYPHRERACLLLQSAAMMMRGATELLEPETFFWTGDPRVGAQQRDTDGAYSEGFDDFKEKMYADEEELAEDLLVGEAEQRIGAFRREFAKAQGSAAQKRLLRRFLRETHPDHNPGKESEVLPVFSYALKLLRASQVKKKAACRPCEAAWRKG